MTEKYRELVELGRYLFQRGYATGAAGNLSLKLDENSVLFSPSGSSLGSLKAEKLAIVTVDGEHIAGDKPTKEANIHLAIYRRKPQSNAIIHLHSTYLTALSCLQNICPENVLWPFTPYVVMRVGDVPLVPYYKPGSAKIAESIASLIEKHNAFLLANHGIVLSGESSKQACYNFEELEETARLYFVLQNSQVRYLSEPEVSELRQMRP